MENIKLNKKQLYSLADLFIRANISELDFSPIEAKILFNLPNPAIQLSDYIWNISASFIQGRIKDEIEQSKFFIYPPKMISSKYIEDHRWHKEGVLIATLEFIESNLTSEVLLEKIQVKLHQNFEYLSLGQARAIIKRKLRQTLTSGERNDLTRLRRKIDGYQKLIGAFENMLDKKSDDTEMYFTPRNLEVRNDVFLEQIQSKLQFFCFECKISKEFPMTSEAVVHPICHSKTMTINWGTHLSPTEASEGKKELERAVKVGYEGLEKADDFRELKTSEKEEIDELITESLDILIKLKEEKDLETEINEVISDLTDVYNIIDVEKISRYYFLSKINNAAHNKSIKHKLYSIKIDGDNSEIAPQIDQLLKNIRNIDYVLSGGKAGFTTLIEAKRLKPIPKKDKKTIKREPHYFCTVCKKLGDIPEEKKEEMFYSSSQELVTHPEHCDKEMEIRIVEHPGDSEK
ncbi:MAG: hypothetical protein GPJ54_03690 [Candidatus Heimdallarchaeota archaeon]|nr:hypothetical protein [Candidatus Heimdallarchaeota archaeon]